MRNMLLLAILCSYVSIGQQLGDAGWVLDESKYDNRFPEMREYAKAGVKGGIPYRDDTPIMLTLSVNAGDEDMSDYIQQSFNFYISS